MQIYLLKNSRCHLESSVKSPAKVHLNKVCKKTLRSLGLCMW